MIEAQPTTVAGFMVTWQALAVYLGYGDVKLTLMLQTFASEGEKPHLEEVRRLAKSVATCDECKLRLQPAIEFLVSQGGLLYGLADIGPADVKLLETVIADHATHEVNEAAENNPDGVFQRFFGMGLGEYLGRTRALGSFPPVFQFDRGMMWPLPPADPGLFRTMSRTDEDPYGKRRWGEDIAHLGPDFGHSCNHCPSDGVWTTWNCKACGPNFQALNRSYATGKIDVTSFIERRTVLLEQHAGHGDTETRPQTGNHIASTEEAFPEL